MSSLCVLCEILRALCGKKKAPFAVKKKAPFAVKKNISFVVNFKIAELYAYYSNDATMGTTLVVISC
jgi:hypothetical protein